LKKQSEIDVVNAITQESGYEATYFADDFSLFVRELIPYENKE
jgi:hypothetical protein